MERQIDKFDKEAEKESRALNWAKENLKTKQPKPYHKSKIIGIKGTGFWQVKE